MKLLVNKAYGGFYLDDKAIGFLMGRGFSKEDAYLIVGGDCPRDLPILHECFHLFGEDERISKIEIEEYEDGAYYIENYDGRETVKMMKDMNFPGQTYEEYRRKEEA